MQYVAFPPALRKQLADLDLQRETGKVTQDAHDATADQWITDAKAKILDAHGLPLDASWMHTGAWGFSPPHEDTDGEIQRAHVFYKP